MPGPVSSLKGLRFPFQQGSSTVPAMNARAESVVDAVRSLLLIGLGEVPLAPFLGTNIYSYIFENLTPLTEARLAGELRRIIEQGEPRMQVTNVSTRTAGDDVGGYRVVLDIEYELNGEPGVLETTI